MNIDEIRSAYNIVEALEGKTIIDLDIIPDDDNELEGRLYFILKGIEFEDGSKLKLFPFGGAYPDEGIGFQIIPAPEKEPELGRLQEIEIEGHPPIRNLPTLRMMAEDALQVEGRFWISHQEANHHWPYDPADTKKQYREIEAFAQELSASFEADIASGKIIFSRADPEEKESIN